LSTAVENTRPRRTGMVVLRGMMRVNTPPAVSTPKESGVTSSSNTSCCSPESTAPCSAAPTATASSGLTARDGFLPKKFDTISCTRGMRV
jgi:hypothetical protein